MSEHQLSEPGTAPERATPALHVWDVVRRRKWHLALGVAIGLTLGIFYYAMAPRTYESTAQVWVLQKRPDAPITTAGATATTPAPAVAAPEDFLDTHQTVLRSSVVLNEAIEHGGLTSLETFRGNEHPAASLKRSLTVARDRDRGGRTSNSQVLNLSFRGPVAGDCGQVLAAVIDSYRAFLNNSTQNTTREALDLIGRARDLVQNDLEQKEKAYVEFRRNSPALWKTQYGTPLYQERLAGLDARRATLAVRLAQLGATLDAVEAARAQGHGGAELLETVASLTTPPSPVPPTGRPTAVMRNEARPSDPLTGLEQELVQLQLREGELLEDYGPEHPRVQAVRGRMQTIRALLAPATTAPDADAEKRRRDAQAQERLAGLKVAALKQEMAELKRTSAVLDRMYKAELQEARLASPYEAQDEAFRRAIDRTQVLYDNVIKRLKDMDLVSSFGGYDAQLISPPAEAERVSPRASLVLPLALLLGLVLGGGLAYLAEMTDKSFRSAEEVGRRLGLPVLGYVPVLADDPGAFRRTVTQGATAAAGTPTWSAEVALVDPSVCTYHRSHSPEAEAYRAVRTALYFSSRGQGYKVIQVTSPNVGDGKTTLAANLAVSMAQSGKRVLLIDADLRRPRLARLFAVPNKVGFASVLAGSVEPSEAILETGVAGLALLPSGPLPPNPAELLTSSRLPELLAWLRERYDYVLLDSPPVLTMTDASTVGPQVDGVVLTLRLTQYGRIEAERTREMLTGLGGNILGVVVNGVNVPTGGYGAGAYAEEKPSPPRPIPAPETPSAVEATG
jgi:succinoglycan biosynthesis transport protein ExoP